MHHSQVALVVLWILPLWLLGWLVFPAASELFPALPDIGLSGGRALALVLLPLAAFWLAATHLVGLESVPYWFCAVPLAIGIGWCKPSVRSRARSAIPALIWSDALFLIGFGCFLWVRLRFPELVDGEKPMDSMLMAGAMRAHYLPFEAPWLAGTSFTNYYYFGPFAAGLLARCFGTPPAYAFNLVFPVFCATFLSVLWSVCSAVTGSKRGGLAAALLVGLGGNLEPLRQLASRASQGQALWPLSGWGTARVIPNTDNEYPAFTLIFGEAHAQFFAFTWAAIIFALAWSFRKDDRPATRILVAIVFGCVLGAVIIGNTWDAPFYTLLFFTLSLSAPTRVSNSNRFALLAALPISVAIAAPYLARFKTPVSGVVLEPWLPPPLSFLLVWGGWIAVCVTAFLLPRDSERENGDAFGTLLILLGLIPLILPFLVYIRGYHGGDYLRHSDTVFKFGLQAWLTLGTGAACAFVTRFSFWLRGAPRSIRAVACSSLGVGGIVLALGPLAWLEERTFTIPGNAPLSSDGARFLNADNEMAIEWLRTHALPGETMVEPARTDSPLTDHYLYGRASGFSGVPAAIGSPSLELQLGATQEFVMHRISLVWAIYGGFDGTKASLNTQAAALRELRPTYIYFPSADGQPQAFPVPIEPDLKIVYAPNGSAGSAGPYTGYFPPFILRYLPERQNPSAH